VAVDTPALRATSWIVATGLLRSVAVRVIDYIVGSGPFKSPARGGGYA
jgi:hypothetical protein